MASSSSQPEAAPVSTGQGIVAVTGASGFIASWIVRTLLERGYTVHGTVRSLAPDKALKYEHLTELPGSKERLKLFEADLGEPGSFAVAFRGAKAVFHVASPFFYATPNPQKDLVEPAVQGTENVVQQAFAEESVTDLIVTSSVTTILQNMGDAPKPVVFNDQHWNDWATLQTQAYMFSKTLAEKKVWELAEATATSKRVATVLPGFVLGPPLCKHANFTSGKRMVALFDGSLDKDEAGKLRAVPTCDVRDVAEAHVRVLENPSAQGRFIACAKTPSVAVAWAEALAKTGKYAKWESSFPTSDDPLPTTHDYALDNTKAVSELGMSFRPIEETLADMADQMIASGTIEPPK